MHFGNTTVVALEEGQKILSQIALVDIIERADNTEVKRNVAAIVCHQDVARVHIGMEEAVAEHLRKENLYACTR